MAFLFDEVISWVVTLSLSRKSEFDDFESCTCYRARAAIGRCDDRYKLSVSSPLSLPFTDFRSVRPSNFLLNWPLPVFTWEYDSEGSEDEEGSQLSSFGVV